MEEKVCADCGSAWPTEKTKSGHPKYTYCLTCGCGLIRVKGDPEPSLEAYKKGFQDGYKKGLQDEYNGIPDDVDYGDTDSTLMLFCNECNKIIKDPVWDKETHGPYCPECKTTLIEKSPDEEGN